MPKGPKGQKRPADVIGNAVKVMRIATGEEAEDAVDDGKDAAAKSLGSRGGKSAGRSPQRQQATRDRAPSREKALEDTADIALSHVSEGTQRCSVFQV